jgi:hypothetical protein
MFFLTGSKISYKNNTPENHPFLIAEKHAEQARHVFALIDTAQ